MLILIHFYFLFFLVLSSLLILPFLIKCYIIISQITNKSRLFEQLKNKFNQKFDILLICVKINLRFFERKGLYLLAITTFSFNTFGYRYTYEVANDLSDKEALHFACFLRNNILQFYNHQSNVFPMFFDVSTKLQEQGYSSLINRIGRLVTFTYFSKWE